MILLRKRERKALEKRSGACRATMNGHDNLLQHSGVATAFQTFLSTWKSLGKTRRPTPPGRSGRGFKAFLSAAQLSRQLSAEEAATIPRLLFSRLSNAPGARGRDRCGPVLLQPLEISGKGGMMGISRFQEDDKFAVLAREPVFDGVN